MSSPQTTIPSTNIVITLNGVPASASITGSSSSWSVSLPLPQNQVLSLSISVTDANGLNKTVTYAFDTFSQNNFMFEAEDFDFNGGQFIDNPTPTAPITTASDSYYLNPEGDGANLAITNIDYTPTFDSGVGRVYRPYEYEGSEVTQDFLRQKFVTNNASDYDLGWWDKGEWYNYTRTYPAGTFKVYGRLASGGAYSGVTLGLVTSGQGTTNQTTKVLGTFSDSTANGYQNWHWVPLADTNGQPVIVTLGGVQTLKLTGGTGQNANFYMLVPAAPQPKLAAAISQNKLQIQIPTQSGFNYTVLYNNSLTGGTWLPLGSSFPGTGATVTVTNTISTTPGQQYYKVVAQ